MVQCFESEKATEEEITKIRGGNYDNASNNAKCFANCIFEKTGVIKDGAIQEAVIMEKFGKAAGEEKLAALLKDCGGMKGVDNCDTSFKLYVCFRKHNMGIEA